MARSNNSDWGFKNSSPRVFRIRKKNRQTNIFRSKKTRKTLDYSLSQGALQALSDAQKAQLAKESVDSAASVWGKALSNIGSKGLKSMLDNL